MRGASFACAVLGLASTATARHSDHGSAAHGALMQLVGTAVNDPGTLLTSPDTQCNKTCTPEWGGSFDHGFEGCSGVYEQICSSTDTKHLFTKLTCEGLWYEKEGNGTDSTYSSCEGGFSFMARGIHGVGDTDESTADSSSPLATLAANDDPRPRPAAFSVGYGCFGKLVSMKTSPETRYMSCDQISGTYMAGKPLPAADSKAAAGSEAAALREATDIGAHNLMEFFQGSPPGPHPERPAHPPHRKEDDHHDHDHGDDHPDHGHHGHHGKQCKVTCNGHPLKLWGLLPCWGKMETTCCGKHGSFTATCKGTTWPRFGSCKGLASVSASGKKGTMYGVNAGKHKVGRLHTPHPGWRGWFQMAEGRASSYSNHNGSEGGVDAAAGAHLASADFQHLSELDGERLAELTPAGMLTQL